MYTRPLRYYRDVSLPANLRHGGNCHRRISADIAANREAEFHCSAANSFLQPNGAISTRASQDRFSDAMWAEGFLTLTRHGCEREHIDSPYCRPLAQPAIKPAPVRQRSVESRRDQTITTPVAQSRQQPSRLQSWAQQPSHRWDTARGNPCTSSPDTGWRSTGTRLVF